MKKLPEPKSWVSKLVAEVLPEFKRKASKPNPYCVNAAVDFRWKKPRCKCVVYVEEDEAFNALMVDVFTSPSFHLDFQVCNGYHDQSKPIPDTKANRALIRAVLQFVRAEAGL